MSRVDGEYPRAIVDVAEEVDALLRRLELDPKVVRSIELDAQNRTAIAEVYELDPETGRKFIRPDGFVATSTRRFWIRHTGGKTT